MSAPKGYEKVLVMYDKPDNDNLDIIVKFKQGYMERIPDYAEQLLTIMIEIALHSSNDPMDAMKLCKEVVECAWRNNGLHIDKVDKGSDFKDRMDRMGL